MPIISLGPEKDYSLITFPSKYILYTHKREKKNECVCVRACVCEGEREEEEEERIRKTDKENRISRDCQDCCIFSTGTFGQFSFPDISKIILILIADFVKD